MKPRKLQEGDWLNALSSLSKMFLQGAYAFHKQQSPELSQKLLQ